jgi:hypothetical protein
MSDQRVTAAQRAELRRLWKHLVISPGPLAVGARASYVDELTRRAEGLLDDADALDAALAERDRYRDALAWYAVAEPREVSADGGVKAWEVLEATGKLPPELADADRAAYKEHVLPYESRVPPRQPRKDAV